MSTSDDAANWHPTIPSAELQEGKPKGVKLFEEGIILGRVDGRVYGLRDKCAHLGVPFSKRPRCFSKEALTCWYHGWTFRWDTGEFVGVFNQPDNPETGPHEVRTYPVRERDGTIFVFFDEADRARSRAEAASADA